MYYSQIRVDPSNDQRIWQLAANMFNSDDGGKTWNQNLVQRIHGDFHAVWNRIRPTQITSRWFRRRPARVLRRAATWDFINTIPLEVLRSPRWITKNLFGFMAACRTTQLVGTKRHAQSGRHYQRRLVSHGGGDGFYSVVDPGVPASSTLNPRMASVSRLEMKTGERKSIRPEARPARGALSLRLEFADPSYPDFNNRRSISAGNRVFRSTDRGTPGPGAMISRKIRIARSCRLWARCRARETLSRHDGVETFGQIVTLAESPIKEGLLYAGTDDGNLQISRASGKTWKNITDRVPGVPKDTYVSRVFLRDIRGAA